MSSENRSKQRCPPGSNPVSPHGLGIALPNTTAVVPQNALSALRTDEQFQGFIDDLPFRFEAREPSRLAHQAFVDIDVGSHINTIHHFHHFLCAAICPRT